VLLEESGSESEHWLPVSVDNRAWVEVEFVCRIYIEYEILLGEEFYDRNLQYVMIEDPTRATCSVYKRVGRKKSGHLINKMSYEISEFKVFLFLCMIRKFINKYVFFQDSVWVFSSGAETCESSLEAVTDEKIKSNNSEKSELHFLLRNGVKV